MVGVVIIVPAAAVMEDRKEPDHGHDGSSAGRQQAGIPFHPLPMVRTVPHMTVTAPRIGHSRPQCLEIDQRRFCFHLPNQETPGHSVPQKGGQDRHPVGGRQRSVTGPITWEGAKGTSAMPIPQPFPFRGAVVQRRRVPCGLPRVAGFRWRSACRVWRLPRVPGWQLSFRWPT